jgi:hypothetical protein
MATDSIQVALEIIDAPEVESMAFRPQRSERGLDFPTLRFSNISRPFSGRSGSAAGANSSRRCGTHACGIDAMGARVKFAAAVNADGYPVVDAAFPTGNRDSAVPVVRAG